MKQDRLQRAKERYADACEAMREQWDRMREDLRFSNPAAPEQWDAAARQLRAGRPCMTFDHTNKFIRQVVNDGRGSTPSIQVSPADSFADFKAAEKLNGRLRHIEYVSRAGIAYDTALELAARCGLGWLRAVPEVLNQETNQQEPKILRVHDPLSCVIDPDAAEPDGSDSEWGFVLSPMTAKKFKRLHPNSPVSMGWTDEFQRWTNGDIVLVAEYFEIVRTMRNKILTRLPDDDVVALTEDEYWEVAKRIGAKPDYIDRFDAEERTVKWSKMTGAEELEETDFPSKYIPLVPVVGSELWVDGKRYLCGMTRQLMDGQRMHNAEMSSYTESILSQPKAPFLVPMRAIEGHEAAWQKLNTGNPSFLPWNDIDPENEQIPVSPPSRMSPPQMPSAFAQGAMMATGEMESAVGMYKSAFGQPSSAVSGRAKLADRRESDTATFHYPDNLARSLEHFGRILLDMDRALTDTARVVRLRGEDGKAGTIRFDPQMQGAVQFGKDREVTAINPRIGEYDVRVKIGPSYLTQNEETAEELGEMFRGAPQLLPILGPTWVRMRNIPGAEKIAKLLLSVAPKEVQSIEAEDDGEQVIPQQAKAQMQQMQQQIEQLSQALEAAAQDADKTHIDAAKQRTDQEKAEGEMLTHAYQAVTDRIKALAPGLSTVQIAAIAQSTFGQALAIPPVDAVEEDPVEPIVQPPPSQPEFEAPTLEATTQSETDMSGAPVTA